MNSYQALNMRKKTPFSPASILISLKVRSSREVALLFGLLVGVVLSLGDIHFFSRGEGREALNAASVLRGEWLLPHGYGGVVASKPPLLHWLIAAFGWWGGAITEMASRLPSFLAALGGTWVVVRRTPPSRRWMVALVLLSSFEWIRAAVSCRVDMVHAAPLVVALLLWPTLRTARTEHTRSLVIGGLLTAASTLAKGPVAILLSSLIFGGWFIVEERKFGVSIGQFFRRFAIWQGVALTVAGLWYGAAFLLGGAEFRDTVLSENVGRFTSTMTVVPHHHGVGYLAATLAVGFLPWTIVMVMTLLPAVRSAFSFETVRAVAVGPREGRLLPRFRRSLLFLRAQLGSLPAFDRYALLVGAVVFVFYSIPGSKRGVYLLVGYPFYAMLIGRLLERGLAGRRGTELRRWFSGALLGLTGTLITLSVLAGITLIVESSWVSVPFFAGLTEGGVSSWVHRGLSLVFEMGIGGRDILGILALLIGVVYGRHLWRVDGGKGSDEGMKAYPVPNFQLDRHPRIGERSGFRATASANRTAAMQAVICCMAIIFVIQTKVQAPLSRYWSERLIAEQIRLFVPADAPLVSWHRDFYGASLYAKRQIRGADPVPREGEYCLVRGADLAALRNELPKPLQPNFVAQAVRGLGGSDTVLIVKIEAPGVGLGSV